MLDGIRVLLVDDDEGQNEMYALALGALGAAVSSAASARDAFEALEREPVDVVVCDLMMPDHDGYEFARGLRADGSELPMIALTGWDGGDRREKALEAGFDEFCVKPCAPSDLARIIKRLLDPSFTVAERR